ncbi:MAG: metallophosphoesterase family protein [Caulobacteraceae bacterium]
MPSPRASSALYAIGDIHGRIDLLDLALEAIAAHARGYARIVTLGDYVDRGPGSRRVVERLMALGAAGACLCLKGNHEALMLDSLWGRDARAFDHWLANGGGETLASYGARAEDRKSALAVVPEAHLRWMERLPLTTADAHRVYVHAGLAPGVPLENQGEAACLWIREAFLRAGPGEFSAHVVHGHTPLWAEKRDAARPERLSHRTNLDTGAFATGVLSVGVFDPATPGGPVEILEARGPPAAWIPRAPRRT